MGLEIERRTEVTHLAMSECRWKHPTGQVGDFCPHRTCQTPSVPHLRLILDQDVVLTGCTLLQSRLLPLLASNALQILIRHLSSSLLREMKLSEEAGAPRSWPVHPQINLVVNHFNDEKERKGQGLEVKGYVHNSSQSDWRMINAKQSSKNGDCSVSPLSYVAIADERRVMCGGYLTSIKYLPLNLAHPGFRATAGCRTPPHPHP